MIFTKLKRYLSVGRHRSKVPTGFIPLKEIKSVVVFADSSDPGLDPTKVRISKFFGDNGISPTFLPQGPVLQKTVFPQDRGGVLACGPGAGDPCLNPSALPIL